MKTSPDPLSVELAERIDAICDDFETAWKEGRSPALETFLAQVPPAEQPTALAQLLRVELELRRRSGQVVEASSYRERFPQFDSQIQTVFSEAQSLVDTSVSQAPATVAFGQDPAAETVEEPVPVSIGRFQILGKIGEGAFGQVFKAHDPQLDRDVAIKLPRRGTLSRPGDLERFLREAKAAANMHHPNICPVYEVGTADGRPYIVMSLVPGKSLAEHIKQNKEPMSIRQAVLIVRKLAQALELAHSKGIVHRDLKPANIILDRERKDVVVMDFGLARDERRSDIGLTVSGMVMGTPAYMSPEQARGDHKAIGPAADIYSLGVILYELLTRQRPFEGSMAEVLGKILHVDAPGPASSRPEVDAQLDEIVRKCLAKDPRQRYPSMRKLAEALTAYLKERAASVSSQPEAQARDADVVAGLPTSDVVAGLPTEPPDSAMDVVSPEAKGPRFAITPVERASQPASGRPGKAVPRGPLIAAAAAFFALLLLGIIFFARTPTAEVFITIKSVDLTDPALSYVLNGKDVPAADLAKPRELKVGSHELLVKRDGALLHRYTFKVSKDAGPRIELGEDPVTPPVVAGLPAMIFKYGGMLRVESGDETIDVTNAHPVLDGPYTIDTIELTGTGVTDDDLALLAPLPKLPQLHLDGTKISDRGLAHLKNVELSKVALGETQITDAGLKHLSGQTKLRTLNLAGTRIGDEGLAHLKAATGLKGINLQGTRVTDKGVAQLAELKELTELWLDGTQVTDEALRALERCEKLHYVSLSNSAVTSEGLAALRKALPNCQVSPETTTSDAEALVARLLQMGAKITRDDKTTGNPVVGVSFYGTAKADDALLAELRHLPSLQSLNLWACDKVTDDGLIPLRELPNLSNLDLGVTRIGDKGVANLKPLAQLQGLNLSYTRVTDAGLAHLAGMTKLKSLALDSLPITDEGLKHLVGLTELTYLNALNTKIEGPGLRHLAGMQKLGQLWLSKSQVDDESLRHLEGLKNLKQLYLDKTRVTQAGIDRIHTILPECEISPKPSKTDADRAAAEFLVKNNAIIAGRLADGSGGIGDPKSVDQLPAAPFFIGYIEASRCEALNDEALAQHAAGLKKLKRINGNNTKFTGTGFAAFKESELQALDLSDGSFTDEGLKAACGIATLQELHLNGHREITDAGLVDLHQLPELGILNLSGTQVTSAGMKEVARCPKVWLLALRDTAIDDAAIEYFLKIKTLKSLELKGSKISPEGLKRLQVGLPGCKVTPEP